MTPPSQASDRSLSTPHGWQRALPLIVVVFPLLLVLQAPISPLGKGRFLFDQSMYAYVAQRWLEGARPYADAWDHKGPLTYLLYTLGFLFSGGRAIGVWVVIWLALQATFTLLYRALRGMGTATEASVGCFLFGAALAPAFNPGGSPEAFALLPAVAGLGILAKMLRFEGDRPQLAAAGVYGLCIAALLLLKANLAAPLIVAIAVYAVARLRNGGVKPLVVEALLGVIGTVVPVVAWWFYAKAIGSAEWFLRAYLDYNLVYSRGMTMSERIASAIYVIKFLAPYCAAPVVFLLALIPWPRGRQTTAPETRTFWIAVWLAFFATWGMGALSGRQYPQYVISLATFLGFFGFLGGQKLFAWWRDPSKGVARMVLAALGGLVMIVGLRGIYRPLRLAMTPAERDGVATDELQRFVRENSAPDDTLLAWNSSAMLNIATNRAAPNRFFYNLPVITKGYAPANVADYVRDLEAHPPKIIVDGDRRGDYAALLPPPDPKPSGLAAWESKSYTDEIEPLRAFVRERYVRMPDLNGYQVFLRK